MNHKGFTLIELMIVISIIGILGIFIFTPIFNNDAHGTDYHFVSREATATAIKEAVITLNEDPNLRVKIMTYIADWSYDNMDAHMDKAQEVANKLEMLGITHKRINMFYANQAGLEGLSPVGAAKIPTPAYDGVYLILFH